MSIQPDQLRKLLVDSGILKATEFDDALLRKEVAQIGLENTLLQLGLLTDEQMGQILSVHFDVPYIDLRNHELDAEVVRLIPESFAREHHLLPVESHDTYVSIATSSPDDALERSLIEKYLRKQVRWVYATDREIQAHMYFFQKDAKEAFESILAQKVLGEQMDTRTISLVGAIIDYAYHAGASDIHIEPEENYTLIRYREDGVLHDVAELPIDIHENIMTRLKVMARVPTDEHRVAQDGKIMHKTQWGEEVEIRLSLIPTTHRKSCHAFVNG